MLLRGKQENVKTIRGSKYFLRFPLRITVGAVTEMEEIMVRNGNEGDPHIPQRTRSTSKEHKKRKKCDACLHVQSSREK